MRCVELVWLRSIHVDGGNKPANSSLAIISTYLSTYILHWDYLSHYCRGMLHNPAEDFACPSLQFLTFRNDSFEVG